MVLVNRGNGRHGWVTLTRTGVVLLGFAWGCQGEPPTSDAPSTPATSIPPATTETGSTGISLPAPGAVAVAAPAAVPLNAAAVAAFATLMTPNVTTEDWDAAQQQLLDLGLEAAPVLVNALGSKQTLERELASSTLVLLGPEVVAPYKDVLVTALQDDSEFVRANVASALMLSPEHSQNALATLVELLTSLDPGLRQLAAMNLRSQPDAVIEHLPAVITCLNHESHPEVLAPLIELLGNLGPEAASSAEDLKRLTAAADPQISQLASTALIQVQGEIQQTQGQSP